MANRHTLRLVFPNDVALGQFLTTIPPLANYEAQIEDMFNSQELTMIRDCVAQQTKRIRDQAVVESQTMVSEILYRAYDAHKILLDKIEQHKKEHQRCLDNGSPEPTSVTE